MTHHIVVPLPKGVSITAAREIADTVEGIVRRGTGTTVEATVTDLYLSDQERRVLARTLDVAQEVGAWFGSPPLDAETLADLRARIDPDSNSNAVITETIREHLLPHPEDLTRPQELAADAMQSEYGRSRVRHVADGAVVIIGLTDDVERRSVCVERDGRERWRA